MTKKNTGNGDNGDNGNERSGIGKVVTGLVVGSVVGATVSLLLAPASGEETIRKIKGKVKGVRKMATKAVGEFEDKALHLADDVSKDINEVNEDIRERVGKYTTGTRREKNSSS